MNPENKINIDRDKEKVQLSFKLLYKNLKKFFTNLLTVDDLDKEGAIENITKDVEFKGFNIWILIASIFICSIGLNLNSTAVVIGAMLISPLMGPINGIGLAIGIFDRSLFLKSLKNLGVTVAISILTSFIFFSIAPLGENQSEILARTEPTFLDLLVAVFGGTAGFLAGSRNIKTNAIPGVAIATALMPPLCTAGFGLASGNWNFFIGAFYLFSINSVFISASALILTRYLKFPFKSYVNPKIQKKTKRYITLFTILVSIPSVFTYLNVLQKSIYKSEINNFLETHFVNNGYVIIDKQVEFRDTINLVNVIAVGSKIKQQTLDSLSQIMPKFKETKSSLKVSQTGGNITEDIEKTFYEKHINKLKQGIIEDVINKKDKIIEEQNLKIVELQALIQQNNISEIDCQQLFKELQAIHNSIKSIRFSNEIKVSSVSSDTIPTLHIAWKNGKKEKETKQNTNQIKEWLKVRYKLKRVEVYSSDN